MALKSLISLFPVTFKKESDYINDSNVHVLLVAAGADVDRVKPPDVFEVLPKLKFILESYKQWQEHETNSTNI
jgi:hypothetical protein